MKPLCIALLPPQLYTGMHGATVPAPAAAAQEVFGGITAKGAWFCFSLCFVTLLSHVMDLCTWPFADGFELFQCLLLKILPSTSHFRVCTT